MRGTDVKTKYVSQQTLSEAFAEIFGRKAEGKGSRETGKRGKKEEGTTMTREEVVQQIRAGRSVAFLTDRGAIATCQTGGVDLIPLASRLYFQHRNDDRLFVDGVAGLSTVGSTSDGDETLDQLMHDKLWADIPEPERDPRIEKLVDEVFAHHGMTTPTPMERQVLREMATKLVHRELLISIAAKMSEKLWGIN
jgi:hypothetical protein